MSEVITFHALDLSGEIGLKLYLRKSDGTLLNTGGDALAEVSSSGMFQATLAEVRTGFGSLAVRVCDGTETADNLLYDGFLSEGSTTIGATVELDSAVGTQIDKIEAAVAGTVTGAGTSTEVFVGPSATLTITVDSSGNRSNVEVT